MAPKVITNEDRVKMGSILDKDDYLRQHNNSETSKKIIKDFEDSGLLFMVTFDDQKVYKKEVVQFYLNATISGDGSIKSKIGDTKIIITTKDIREEFRLPEASNFNVSSHSFNHKLFSDEIKSETAPRFIKFNGKKKVLPKPK